MGFMDCVEGNILAGRQHFIAQPNTFRKVWLKLRRSVINLHWTLTQSHLCFFDVKLSQLKKKKVQQKKAAELFDSVKKKKRYLSCCSLSLLDG